MSKDQAEVKRFIEALKHEGYNPKSYSGRGMFGKECVSVSDEDMSAWVLANYLGRVGIYTPEPRQDSLGLDIVLYWPQYEWPKEIVI